MLSRTREITKLDIAGLVIVTLFGIGLLFALRQVGLPIELVLVVIAAPLGAGLFFYRPEILVYAAVFAGVFYTPLSNYSFRVASILLTPTDIVFLTLISIFALRLMLKQSSHNPPSKNEKSGQGLRLRHWVTLFFVLAILYATVLGLLQGNFWKTIFRETKLIIYYGSIFIFIKYILDRKIEFTQFFWILLLLTTVGSMYDLYARIFDIYPGSAFSGWAPGAVTYAYTPFGKIIRDYGWVSTFHYQVFAVMICIVYIFKTKIWFVRLFLAALLLVNLIANMLTVTRGFMLGMLVGGISVILFMSLEVTKSGKLSITKFVKQFVIGIVLLSSMLFVASQVVPEVNASIYRLLSVVDKNYAGAGDDANANLRLSSIQLGIETALQKPEGMGFGIEAPDAGAKGTPTGRILYLLYHNSLGFIFYSFGLFVGIAVLGLLIYFMIRLPFAILHHGTEHKENLTIIGSNYVALLAMTFTSGNYLFAIDNVLPYAIFLLSAITFYISKRR